MMNVGRFESCSPSALYDSSPTNATVGYLSAKWDRMSASTALSTLVTISAAVIISETRKSALSFGDPHGLTIILDSDAIRCQLSAADVLASLDGYTDQVLAY
jgi:hypothetical protein